MELHGEYMYGVGMSDALAKLKEKKEAKDAKSVPSPNPKANHDLVQAMKEKLPAEKIINALTEALEAKRESRGKMIADHRSRIDAAKLFLNYVVGTPVQRQEQVNYNFDMDDLDEGELLVKLAESPAMRRKVLDVITKAEEIAEAKKRADAVDV